MATLDRPLDRPRDGAPGVQHLAGFHRIARSIPRSVLLGLVLLVLGALGVLQVLQTSQVATLGYELSALEHDRAQLQAEIRQLKADVANEGTMKVSQQRAEQELQMIAVEPAFRISVAEPAPAGISVPRRFVEIDDGTAVEVVEDVAWWERMLAQLLGAQ